MRPIILSSCVLFLVSCATKETAVTTNDSTIVESLADAVAPPALDSAAFIAEARYFPATNEYYTPVYYQSGVESTQPYEKLDSAETSDENGVKRKKLSLSEAKKFFYLKGLDTLSFYDSKHQFLGRAPLSGIEYLDNQVSSEFVAVYKLENKNADKNEIAYCTSNKFIPTSAPDFSAQVVNEQGLTEKIVRDLKLGGKENWTAQHIKLKPSENVLSILSKDAKSLIVESDNGGVKILKEVNNDYHFGNMFPLPFAVNGKPVLLISYYVPESDVTGDFTAIFNGDHYEAVHFSRIPAKKFQTSAL